MMRLPERAQEGALLLRRWLIGDAHRLEQAIVENLEHLRPWMSWMVDEPIGVERRRAMLGRWEREWEAGGDVHLAVLIDGHLAGGAGLLRRRGPDTLEIGYWTHRHFLRQGVASLVARLLTDAAFTVPGIERVEIHHDRANVASSGIPRRLGYRMTGETPDGAAAPAESGIRCVWQMDRAQWALPRPRVPEAPRA